MKRSFVKIIAANLFAISVAGVLFAQGQNATASLGTRHFLDKSKTKEAIEPLPAQHSGISLKVVRSFVRNYRDATHVKWISLRDGFTEVNFTADGVRTRLFYDARGVSEKKIRNYFEDRLPPEVRHLVKSTYYDFRIHNINEVTVNGSTAYVVMMEGKTTWKIVKVVDGEMADVDEYVKK